MKKVQEYLLAERHAETAVQNFWTPHSYSMHLSLLWEWLNAELCLVQLRNPHMVLMEVPEDTPESKVLAIAKGLFEVRHEIRSLH